MSFSSIVKNNIRKRSAAEYFGTGSQTYPTKLYIITSFDGKYALTATDDGKIILEAPDTKKNTQWIIISEQTGMMYFYYGFRNYLNISVNGETDSIVTLSMTAKNPGVLFTSEDMIILKDFPSYCFAYKKAETFIGRMWKTVTGTKEKFENPLLGVFPIENINSSFSNKWKAIDALDLKEAVEKHVMEENIKEIKSGAEADKLTLMEELMKTKDAVQKEEIALMLAELEYYRSHWLVKLLGLSTQ